MGAHGGTPLQILPTMVLQHLRCSILYKKHGRHLLVTERLHHVSARETFAEMQEGK